MKHKKNRFFTCIFSMMFGAGQMYMGFMRQGLSIMGCALGIIAVGITTNLSIVYLILPLLWFYSFFDSMNKRALTNEEFMKLEDSSIFPIELNTEKMNEFAGKYQIYIGGGFIFLGICILNNSVLSYIFPQGSLILRMLGPQFLISVVMIVIGVRMILSKNNELSNFWKIQKNTVENSFKKEEQIINHNESLVDADKGIPFDINLFKAAADEENKVSMAMFQEDPDSKLNTIVNLESPK